MSKTAVLIDGGFFRKRAAALWGRHSAEESADAVIHYAMNHLYEHGRRHELYRIFYYDCPPVSRQMFHPLLQKNINLGASPEYKWMTDFLRLLKTKRKVALRLGVLDDSQTYYTLKYETVKKLCSKAKTVEELTERDFEISLRQKGVDMKIGIDIASLSYKHQVDQIVLIAGDRDFVPAAKQARREGIDFILDPLHMSISPDNELLEHIDGKRSCGNPFSNGLSLISEPANDPV